MSLSYRFLCVCVVCLCWGRVRSFLWWRRGLEVSSTYLLPGGDRKTETPKVTRRRICRRRKVDEAGVNLGLRSPPCGSFQTKSSPTALLTGCLIALITPYTLQQSGAVAGIPAVRSTSGFVALVSPNTLKPSNTEAVIPVVRNPSRQVWKGAVSPPPLYREEAAARLVLLAVILACLLLSLLSVL